MNRIYLIQTTSGQPWEIVGGYYIVKAINKEEAKKKFWDSFDIKKNRESIENIIDISEEIHVPYEIHTPYVE